ncbi:MAG TPA: ribosome maturation factor RimM [Candidatus Binatia bacterium]|nr:ribosome maturation factor RimM [Candidatus Binatia bacterium]
MTPSDDDVIVGRIAGIFGVRGELKCDPSSAGRTLFFKGARFRCARDAGSGEVEIAEARPHKGRLLVRIEGVGSAEAAQAYVGAAFYAPRERIELREGEYLDEDLAGCDVLGVDGTNYGRVERVEHYPASDMLVVAGRMVPMVAAIVREIALDRRRIVIDPPAGLL